MSQLCLVMEQMTTFAASLDASQVADRGVLPYWHADMSLMSMSVS